MSENPVRIEKKIVAQSIAKSPKAEETPQNNEPEIPPGFSEKTKRPYSLNSQTYKIKPGSMDNALYITISDIVVNEGTEFEEVRPYEIFLNSLEADHFQWIVAQTRLISAMFRKGGDLNFMVDELKSVHDPKGGYFSKGTFYPSVVAHIGMVIEDHFKKLGRITGPELTEGQVSLIAEKRAQYEAQSQVSDTKEASSGSGFPPDATVCKSCSEKAVILLDGCQTCLSCGEGKCQ